jgi:hypothetical protein
MTKLLEYLVSATKEIGGLAALYLMLYGFMACYFIILSLLLYFTATLFLHFMYAYAAVLSAVHVPLASGILVFGMACTGLCVLAVLSMLPEILNDLRKIYELPQKVAQNLNFTDSSVFRQTLTFMGCGSRGHILGTSNPQGQAGVVVGARTGLRSQQTQHSGN